MHENILTKIMLMILVITCSFTIVSCRNKTTSSKITVRVGYFANIAHSQALVGIATGDFEKALGNESKIEWKLFNAGPAEIEGLLARNKIQLT